MFPLQSRVSGQSLTHFVAERAKRFGRATGKAKVPKALAASATDLRRRPMCPRLVACLTRPEIYAARVTACGRAAGGSSASLWMEPWTGTVCGIWVAGSSVALIDDVGPSIVEITCPLTVLIG